MTRPAAWCLRIAGASHHQRIGVRRFRDSCDRERRPRAAAAASTPSGIPRTATAPSKSSQAQRGPRRLVLVAVRGVREGPGVDLRGQRGQVRRSSALAAMSRIASASARQSCGSLSASRSPGRRTRHLPGRQHRRDAVPATGSGCQRPCRCWRASSRPASCKSSAVSCCCGRVPQGSWSRSWGCCSARPSGGGSISHSRGSTRPWCSPSWPWRGRRRRDPHVVRAAVADLPYRDRRRPGRAGHPALHE